MTTNVRFILSAINHLLLHLGTVILVVSLSCLANQHASADWSIVTANDLVLDTSGVGFSVAEMSGVTYLGPSPAIGKHRFLAVQDSGTEQLVTFDATFDLGGNLLSAVAISNQTLEVDMDFEGIVQVGDSIYLSEENGPGVRQYNPATGTQLQNVSIPALFTDNADSNLGFESLAYDEKNNKLWTATEGALTVDGSAPTSVDGTIVRLLELDASNNPVTAGKQYAYMVEPVHKSGSFLESGLVELVVMPDDVLLALERSFVVSNFVPSFENRIYELDVTGATDISQAPFDEGLIGEIDDTFAFVDKGDPENPIWVESVGGGSFGQNLEGLAVGPRLANGDYILLGVVDGGASDPISDNTIVSLIASPSTPIDPPDDTGDFDSDSDRDGADFLAWQRGFGVTTLAGLTDGDGNHSGTVTGADLAIWESQFGTTTAPPATSQAVPEPGSLALLLIVGLNGLALSRVR